MGVAGTVLSITLVALTLASSQFGPRLIKNFMYVSLNQVVLGSYISTYLYCLLVLNAVKEVDSYTFIPAISILVAILAAITNIILLIVFIHQIAISIQADKVISGISDFISKQVETLFSKKMEEEKDERQSSDRALVIAGYQKQTSIKSPKSGYLQYIDYENLMKFTTKKESLLVLNYRPGAHLVEGMKIGLLYSDKILEENEIDKFTEQFVIGTTKTSQQDLEFSIHQMVEIAARALSPRVNDPYTVMTCIDNLTAIMCHLTQVKFPSKYHFDEKGILRLMVDTLDFEGVLDAAFNQIRQFSGGSPSVIIRLMEAMIKIYGFTQKVSYKKAVIKHAEMVLKVGKDTMKEKNDVEDLIRRSENILEI